VGALGVNTSDLVGFDISGSTGLAFASLTPPTGAGSSLYTINLATGAATLVGTIDGGSLLVRDYLRGHRAVSGQPRPLRRRGSGIGGGIPSRKEIRLVVRLPIAC
jgi:hypothetical protein